jgi:hypothetical protein
MRRRNLIPVALATLVPAAQAQPRQGPPHEWLFGTWTGGIFPALDTQGPGCFGNPVVIFTRDVVMRMASLDVAYRQRLIETVAVTPDGVEFRFLPLQGPGGRLPPESGFGCDGNPNLLRVTRRGDDEIAFTNCIEFPSVLRRCRTS